MDVSIIVPVYNSSRYLRRCFDSIIKQVDFDANVVVELIVVNNCSFDLLDEKIIKEYETAYPNVFYSIKTNENKHPGGARNLGIKAARGTYIYFVDSDDFIDTDAIKTMYSKAISDNADIVVCGHKIHNNGEITEIQPIPFNCANPYDYFPCVWCMMVKRQLIIDNGLFFPEKTYYEDSISLFWYLASKKTVSVTDVYYNWYVHDGSSSLSNKTMLTSAPKAYKYMVNLPFYKTLDSCQCKAVASCSAFQLYRDVNNIVIAGNLDIINNYCVELQELSEAFNMDFTNIDSNDKAFCREINTVFKYIQCHIHDINFVADFIEFYKTTRENIFLTEISKYNNICLWGAGAYGKEFAFMLKNYGIPYVIVDKNKDKVGDFFDEGIIVNDWDTVKEKIETVIVTALFAFNDINNFLRENNYSGQILNYNDFVYMKRMTKT